MMERLVGKPAPSFTMNAVKGDGSDFLEIKSEDYKGKWLVMFFYPLDFTFVCPTEITAFSDRYEDFKKLGAELLTVSCDSEYSHQAWIKQDKANGGLGQINFPMASDKKYGVAKDYGVFVEEEAISLRGLFIIDPDGEVKYQVVHDLNVGRNVDETIRVLKALQTGGMCPANWEEGESLL
ncbi:peroxiredoxin [Clostridium algidicarnis]|nr:peroxiredoxin [Clostridium algidicarnis]MBU3228984.1 peroxiredoxin [Clostridium algidicarnis]MBU3252528.1 peroxiredoxin [Clostridium algidicarnis]